MSVCFPGHTPATDVTDPEDASGHVNRAPALKGNGFSGQQDRLPASAEATEQDGRAAPLNWRAEQIREWLLLILRFAITHDARDQTAVSSKADELDAIGVEWRPSAPSFFRRTSSEICDAITNSDGGERASVLKRHLGRIDDIRLRRALQAAVGLGGRQPRASRANRQYLWVGLAQNLNRRSDRSV